MNKLNNVKDYLIFWFGQMISQLGSSITSFALTIWVFNQTGSAMSVSLLTFCSFLPYVLVSIFAGGFVDKYSKKRILILADSIAALCTVSIFISIQLDMLTVWHIYIVNIIVGFMNAFQSPTASIVTGLLVPEGQYDKASGLNSFSDNLITVVSPVLAGMLMAFSGLEMILIVDFLSFLFAVGTVILITVKEPVDGEEEEKDKPFDGLKDGWKFLKENKGILYIMLTMSLLNFFSRLTYENILSPMILSRTGGDSNVYGIVSGILGIGGILGGVWVTVGKKKNPIKMIYFSAAISFLFGDLLMGFGQNVWVWAIAGLAASLPIPFVFAGQSVILYEMVPVQMQGRIFSIKNTIQYSTIPLGILLGGFLADYVFEPFMASNNMVSGILQKVVGKGAGSGMAVMFLCTGILGSTFCCIAYRQKHIQKLNGKKKANT